MALCLCTIARCIEATFGDATRFHWRIYWPIGKSLQANVFFVHIHTELINFVVLSQTHSTPSSSFDTTNTQSHQFWYEQQTQSNEKLTNLMHRTWWRQILVFFFYFRKWIFCVQGGECLRISKNFDCATYDFDLGFRNQHKKKIIHTIRWRRAKAREMSKWHLDKSWSEFAVSSVSFICRTYTRIWIHFRRWGVRNKIIKVFDWINLGWFSSTSELNGELWVKWDVFGCWEVEESGACVLRTP